MEVKIVAEGREVIEYMTIEGKTYRTPVRVCNTEAEAKAVANYYRLLGNVD